MKLYKIETYLPKEALDNIKNALCQLGFGKVGNYDCCMSWHEVNSSWRPLDGANPYQGVVNKVEFATEYKLEFRCCDKDLQKVVESIKLHHPYEEVCINIIPLYVI
ncbi:MAG: cytochrome C biogenesis protein [Clostridia bacterium]|nr:cytochrome C biogenesis protein [Clostridia bacterium]